MSTYSHSEVDTRNKCERAWYYGYALGVEPISKGKALNRGTLGHKGLEAFFNALKDGHSFSAAKVVASATVTSMTNEDPLAYAECLGDVLRGYEAFFDEYPFHNWTVLDTEKVYMLEVNEDLSVPIIVDLIVQDPYGDIWVVDNKFLYDFPTGVENEILPQLALYAGVCRANGVNVAKAAYSILRTRKIAKPVPGQMYKFEPVPLTQERIDRNFIEHAIVADRCHKDKQKPLEVLSWEMVRVKQPLICKNCYFNDICLAELNGHQPELVLSTYYQTKQRRQFNGTSV